MNGVKPLANAPRTWAVPIEETLSLLHEREARKWTMGLQRATRIRTRLQDARQLLCERGASRVRVFGSLATGGFSEGSDVDLAVWDLPPRSQFRCMADLATLLDATVDLILWEDAPQSLRDRILAEGWDP